MAGDWIKVEAATPNKPEILKISRMLGITKDDAFGKVMRFWLWLDSVCVDGHVDGVVSTDVDAIVDACEFANALKSVGWIDFNDVDEIIEIPNFERHNGETAKKRALRNRRQKKWRENVDDHVDTGVSTNASTREEKRRDKEKIQKESRRFSPPSVSEVRAYVETRSIKIDPNAFVDFYTAKGWMVGKTKMIDWKASVRTWERKSEDKTKTSPHRYGKDI